MTDPNKKVSFGFSKLKKPSVLVKPVQKEETKIEYVDTFDGDAGKFSYQGVRLEEEVKKDLIIPLTGTKTAYDVIQAKLENRKDVSQNIKIEDAKHETNDNNIVQNIITDVKVKDEVDVKPSLDSLAAQEIIANLTQQNGAKGSSKGMVIAPDLDKPNLEGEEESTLDDYEDVPVDEFGLAMLRGMGWTPQSGIGKESKIVPAVTSVPRPKRLGLGADKAMLGPAANDLPLIRGSYIRVLAGGRKGDCGIVESVDGDTGGVFVKFDDGNIASLSENLVSGITKADYENRNEQKVNPKKERVYGIDDGVNKSKGSTQSSNVDDKPVKRKSRERSDSVDIDHGRRNADNRRRSYSSDSGRKSDHSRSSESEPRKKRKKKRRNESSDSSEDSDDNRSSRRRDNDKKKSVKKKKKRTTERESYRKKSSKRDRSRSRSRDRRYKKQKSRRRSRS